MPTRRRTQEDGHIQRLHGPQEATPARRYRKRQPSWRFAASNKTFDTCVLRLTRVSAQQRAIDSVSRVCIASHVAACALFLAQASSSYCDKCCCQLFLNILARRSAITSVLFGAVGNCLGALLVGYALQPVCVPLSLLLRSAGTGATHSSRASRVLWNFNAVHEKRAREDLMTLPGESWS